MKLTKENVYVNLRGKTKEELTDLWEFLDNAGEKQYDDKENFINDNYYNILSLDEDNEWSLCLETSIMLEDKKEVTIEQLKEILQPKDLTLEQQLQKAEAEVKRLKEAIEEENKIKVGDLVKCTNKHSDAKYVIGIVEDLHPGFVGVGGTLV